MPTIVVGGDIYPAGTVRRAFEEGKADDIFHDLLEVIAGADLSIVNLECPLVLQETPIAKAGPVLGAGTSCINGFAAAGWDVLNLANNHSFDHGATGLRETIRTIREAGLDSIGAGENITDAQRPVVREIEGERIVIYSMAEREFSVADEAIPGANPLDLVNCVYAIRQHRQNGSFVVLIHGGTEYYPYPSPEMVKRCRFIIDMGADAVICCHTHCALPWEIYADRPIVYGLGNLVFEAMGREADAWYEGYLAKLTIKDGHVGLEAIPYGQSRRGSGARRMKEDEERGFRNEMERRSDQVRDGQFISDQWLKHCRRQQDSYLAMLFGYNRVMRRFHRLLLPMLHPSEAIRQAFLLVQCEAHQEVLKTIFNNVRSRR